MKLIKQITLYLKEDNSDKVYEVDLCEVGDKEFVVNFRYGRRNTALKEGTKTVFPVAFIDAEKVFYALVNSKKNKGYSEKFPTSAGSNKSVELKSPNPKAVNYFIVNRLIQCVNGTNEESSWKSSRVVWRAGLLRIREAAPHLVKLLKKKDFLFQYCNLWALGRCGSQEHLPLVIDFIQNKNTPSMVRRIAFAAAIELCGTKTNREVLNPLIDLLPEFLKNNFEHLNSSDIHRIFEEHLSNNKTSQYGYLTTLYLLSKHYSFIVEPLLHILAKIPLKPNYFREIRYIYKIAEFRDDSAVLGRLMYSIQKNNPYFTGKNSAYIDGMYLNISRKEYAKANAKIAYSKNTREYFIRRSIKTLRHFGETGSSLYTSCACEMLLQFNDDVDLGSPEFKEWRGYINRTWSTIITHFDAYSNFRIFFYVLYSSSPRYETNDIFEKMRCTGNYKPGEPGPNVREEGFQKLWDQDPNSLIRLLSESKCGRVHEFACKALKGNSDHNELITIKNIAAFIISKYKCTILFAIELAQKVFDINKPNFELIASFFKCNYEEGRQIARDWIEKTKFNTETHSDLFVDLFYSKWQDNRDWINSYLSKANLISSVRIQLVHQILEKCLIVNQSKNELCDLKLVAGLIKDIFPIDSAKIEIMLLKRLINHSIVEIQEMGATLLLINEIRTEKIPEEIFNSLLESESSSLQKLGIELIGKLEDHFLEAKAIVIKRACLSAVSEVRKVAIPIIIRLARKNNLILQELIKDIMPCLLREEISDGFHEDLFFLFGENLIDCISIEEVETIWRYVKSNHLQANLLGIKIVKKNLKPTELGLKKIIALAHHEVEEGRSLGQEIFNTNISYIKDNKDQSIRILDTDWDATRLFAFQYFRNNFNDSDWTPNLIVSIVDSIRPDVQGFGRELITKFFKEGQGVEYLLKLCQHPSADVQLFSTNFLEKHARDNYKVLVEMEQFFISVLTLVNQGRVARLRVLNFLRDEALKNKLAAEFVTRILNEISLTSAIGNKALCIETLLEIKNKYPDLNANIRIIQTPAYAQESL